MVVPLGISLQSDWGLASRPSSVAFGRTKTNHSDDLRTRRRMWRESLAVDAPCRRTALLKRQQRISGARAVRIGGHGRQRAVSRVTGTTGAARVLWDCRVHSSSTINVGLSLPCCRGAVKAQRARCVCRPRA